MSGPVDSIYSFLLVMFLFFDFFFLNPRAKKARKKHYSLSGADSAFELIVINSLANELRHPTTSNSGATMAASIPCLDW